MAWARHNWGVVVMFGRRMSRRFRALVAVAASASIATACITPTPPRSSPVIVSASLATPTVTAGSDVAVDIVASAGYPISAALRVSGPNGAQLPLTTGHDCNQSNIVATPFPVGAPNTPVAVTATCTMPSWAPNGTWVVSGVVYPSDLSVLEVPVYRSLPIMTFELVGGSEDFSAPEISLATPLPATVAPGGSFPLDLRIEDEHPAIQAVNPLLYLTRPMVNGVVPPGVINCVGITATLVDPTTVSATTTCYQIEPAPPGTYSGEFQTLDLLGYRSTFTVSVVVAD